MKKKRRAKREVVYFECLRCRGSGRLVEAVTRRGVIYSTCTFCRGKGRLRVRSR